MNTNSVHIMINLYIVTGFISTGKTKLINEELRQRKKLASTGIITFELGHTSHIVEPLVISPDDTELVISPNGTESIMPAMDRIKSFIDEHAPKEIWIEWNGTIPFHVLESIIYAPELSYRWQVQKVIYTAQDITVLSLLKGLGTVQQSQAYAADLLVVYGTSSNINQDVRHALQSLNDNTVSYNPSAQEIHNYLAKPIWPWSLYSIAALMTLYILLVTLFRHDIPYSIHRVLGITSGIILEGIPFLLLGTMVATAIRLFVPDRWISTHLQGNSIKSYLLAMSSGLLLPVCDCATIPLFKAFVKKGIPLHIALLFMLSAPIMNPIALLATYYAFPDASYIMGYRILGGLAVALIVSQFFKWRPMSIEQNVTTAIQGQTYEHIRPSSMKRKQFVYHTEKEFLTLLTYFSLAAATIGVFQVWIKPLIFTADGSWPTAITSILLLGFAFIFSLCSTSDAIIGKSLSTVFPMPSILGFLILGPMIDIKNVYILSRYTNQAFTMYLTILVSTVTFIMTILFQFLI